MDELTSMEIITKDIIIKNNMLPPGEYNISPRFTRKIEKNDDNKYVVSLSVEMKDTDQSKFPIYLFIEIAGIFGLENIPDQKKDDFLKIQAVHVMFPYLRAMVSNITSSAMMQPIILPIYDAKSLFQDNVEGK
jgi:preprotein translocase subunit SecB